VNELEFSKVVFKKNNGALVKITMSDFRNQVYIHVRDYQMDGDTGYWYPTKTGYAFIAEEIDNIIDALKYASEMFAKYSRNLEYNNENQLEFKFEEVNN
jgi:hypothetical protein